MSSKEFYKRYLPHIQPKGRCFFVTFRLYGSLPKSVVSDLREKYNQKLSILHLEKDEHSRNAKVFELRKRYLSKTENELDHAIDGPQYLSEDKIREIVANQLKKFDGEFYKLIAYSIMSNHVHILIDTSIQLDNKSDKELKENYTQLDQIMKRIKGPTAVYSNRELNQ